MKVFISWSGDKSKRIAELVDTWLQCTIQSSQPWMSTRSIDRGALWFSEITAELADTTIGIICLTKENKDKPWILFESGALAKGLSSSRICTFLIDLEPADLENPLAQFNHTIFSKNSLQQLLSTINSLSETPLKPQILETVFEKYWPEFETNFNTILAEDPPKASIGKRNQNDVLSEILNTIRGLDRRMVSMEENAINLSNKQFYKNSTEQSMKQAIDMLNQGNLTRNVVNTISNKFGFSETQSAIIVNQALQSINKNLTNPGIDVSGDMLEQLKRKFDKL